ncbi:MAG: hypothetical protein C0P67_010665 [Bacillota bacterium]
MARLEAFGFDRAGTFRRAPAGRDPNPKIGEIAIHKEGNCLKYSLQQSVSREGFDEC